MGVAEAGAQTIYNNKMSSRAFRRLHGDVDVIKLPASNIEDEDIDDDDQINPNLQQNKRKDHSRVNPFELVSYTMADNCMVLV